MQCPIQARNSAFFVGERRVRDPDATVSVIPGTEIAAHARWHGGAVEALGKVARVPERIAADDLGLPLLALVHESPFTRVDDPGRDRVDADTVCGCEKMRH